MRKPRVIRPKLKTKLTAKGKLRGRPRKNADDPVMDMPPEKPGRQMTTESIVHAVRLSMRADRIGEKQAIIDIVDHTLKGEALDRAIAQRRMALARVRKKIGKTPS